MIAGSAVALLLVANAVTAAQSLRAMPDPYLGLWAEEASLCGSPPGIRSILIEPARLLIDGDEGRVGVVQQVDAEVFVLFDLGPVDAGTISFTYLGLSEDGDLLRYPVSIRSEEGAHGLEIVEDLTAPTTYYRCADPGAPAAE